MRFSARQVQESQANPDVFTDLWFIMSRQVLLLLFYVCMGGCTMHAENASSPLHPVRGWIIHPCLPAILLIICSETQLSPRFMVSYQQAGTTVVPVGGCTIQKTRLLCTQSARAWIIHHPCLSTTRNLVSVLKPNSVEFQLFVEVGFKDNEQCGADLTTL